MNCHKPQSKLDLCDERILRKQKRRMTLVWLDYLGGEQGDHLTSMELEEIKVGVSDAGYFLFHYCCNVEDKQKHKVHP